MRVVFEGSMSGLPGFADGPWYHVQRSGGRRSTYDIKRVDMPCHIGTVTKRGEAVRIARMLAGWHGKVTTATGNKGRVDD